MLFVLAVVTLVVVFVAFIDFATGYRRLRFLRDIPPGSGQLPSISIVAAARNEARGIEHAVRSLLTLDYPALQLTIVNDRSTDATGAILQRLSREEPRLEVVTVSELPAGWLGKNHALWVGAARSTGELLLFTDADIIFEPTTLRRAATLFASGTDHLTAIPDTRVPGVALNAMVAAFSVFFSMYARPWKASDPKSRSHIGVGAFNLLRASTYQAIGTHQVIAMRPDDDLKLGKLVKKHGFRQDVIVGKNFIIVEWYASLREMIDGLMKNAFAGVDYSLSAVAASTAALVLMNVWPFLALFVTGGLTRAVNAVTVLLIVGLFWITARYSGTHFTYVLGYPVAALLFAYIIWRSAIIAVATGSITWRGTAYPLAEMRANRI